jgi:anti-sigma B factor antagonist
MNGPMATMSVCLEGKVVCIKITGRASFSSSEDFKKLVKGLRQKGHARFVLDLTDCMLMDSTFSGVLASVARNLACLPAGDGPVSFELLNANQRVADALDNLGVSPLFKLTAGTPFSTDQLAPVPPSADDGNRIALTRTLLEAHLTLMEINPANVPKFKDVAQFLEEDLKKMESEQKDGGS